MKVFQVQVIHSLKENHLVNYREKVIRNSRTLKWHSCVFCILRKRKEIADHAEKKRLAPLNEGGPAQLLNIQIQKLEEENQDLRNRLKTVS